MGGGLVVPGQMPPGKKEDKHEKTLKITHKTIIYISGDLLVVRTSNVS